MRDTVEIPARPEPIAIEPSRTAVVVVDVQNAYASPGGYLDLLGIDISGAAGVVQTINTVLGAARGAGMPVVFLQNGWSEDLHEAGTPDSPYWRKSNALRLMRTRPELRGKLLIKGTWDHELVAELKREPDDLVVSKPRYSGFWATNLDLLLRSRDIRHLIFTGIASNVCVESTLRDALFLEYSPIMLEDATLHAGPRAVHEATVYNVEMFFGWVTTSAAFVGALGPASRAT